MYGLLCCCEDVEGKTQGPAGLVAVDLLEEMDGLGVGEAVALAEQLVGKGQVKAVEASARGSAGLSGGLSKVPHCHFSLKAAFRDQSHFLGQVKEVGECCYLTGLELFRLVHVLT